MQGSPAIQKNIAVIGTGISGMSAAWLLSQRHKVTVYECDRRVGGHSNTVTVQGAKGPIAVDTGFIVYNEATYPNLTALFDHLNVPTQPSDMSFAVSLADGDLEYSGNNLSGLFAEKRNLFRPRFWSMLRDLQRFYREAPRDLAVLEEFHTTLGDYLDAGAYGAAFRNDHLLPMAAAIWSAPTSFDPRLSGRLVHPLPGQSWPAPAAQSSAMAHRPRRQPRLRRTADAMLTRIGYAFRQALRRCIAAADFVKVRDRDGHVETFDHVVIATHADQALAMLDDPTAQERRLLGAFRYSRNTAVLHSDPALMPKRRAVWSSWNHIGPDDNDDDGACPTVTYWMNLLQNIPHDTPLFVTLNPRRMPRNELHSEIYEHPLFDSAAITAQRQLWSLQGQRRTWFCGAYFGAGFHEDGLQAGLAVAEALGGVRRPWTVANESGRIAIDRPAHLRTDIARIDAGARRMSLRSTLYVGSVMHRRVRPRAHKLRYRVFWMLLDLDEIDDLPRRLRLFSRNRFNAVSFHDADHGDGGGRPLREQAESHLRKAGIEMSGGAIKLLCMPRVFGYGFNPLSIYFCYLSDGSLAAILYEVHNTFGERHSYLIPIDRAAGAAGTIVDQHCEKVFYVSPFMDMDMTYAFRVAAPAERVTVAIRTGDKDGLLLFAALDGARVALTDRALLRAVLTYPLLTLKVVGAIHWHALRMLLKGFRLRSRPNPPSIPVTVVNAKG